METQILSKYYFDKICAVYAKTGDKVSLILVPDDRVDQIKQSKLSIADHMLQIFVSGDLYSSAYGQGISLRNSEDLTKFKLVAQRNEALPAGQKITTVFEREEGHTVNHILIWDGYDYLRCCLELINHAGHDVGIELLSSFSLSCITPFVDGEAPNSLVLHRMRSYWSEEGRLESIPLEDLGLAASWLPNNIKCERYGQVGTMPVRKYFPFAAIEDSGNQVTWAAQIAWAGSWQMEVFRKGNAVSLSGGLADYEFGHFKKLLKPGERITSPEAYLTVVNGDVEQACACLTEAQELNLDIPPSEEQLPILYNEYCDTWGKPTEANIERQLKAAQKLGACYFVIDAGWYDDDDWWATIGDWKISGVNFPDGIDGAVSKIKAAGMIPGIWFEFENVGPKSDAFVKYHDHLLKRDGKVILSGTRAFWDMCDPWVQEYLHEHVIGFLKRHGFGYIKVDYNETCGMGCDGAESFGEALRRQVIASQRFFKRIREEVPGIIIENCASGGHRLEPSMMALSSMASFSDAHELVSVPIIAANLHRAILPRQSQIWAVLHPEDSDRRLIYSLANTFLGRMCLSGNIYQLSERQFTIAEKAIEFYKAVSAVVKHGTSRRFGPKIRNYNVPEGWQAVVRFSTDSKTALVVAHTFQSPLPDVIEIADAAFSNMAIKRVFGEAQTVPKLEGTCLRIPVSGEFGAAAVLLKFKD